MLIYDLNLGEFSELLKTWGEPGYRARQIWSGIYGNLWNDPEQFTNIPGQLKDKLFQNFSFKSLNPVTAVHSRDHKTSKTLFEHPDGLTTETVLMRYEKPSTLCISTQVGCAMGCVFCATGQMGFSRNLTSGEIVEQVIHFERELRQVGDKLTNIVVMGMGEPFQNYEDTMKAIDVLNDAGGFCFGERRFTISTVGLVPKIRQFADEKRQINLAISLHASDDETRSRLVPLNKKYPIKELMDSCRYYFEQTHRRISFEWALINNVNDSVEQSYQLAGLLRGLPSHVNLILLNPTRKFKEQASSQQRAVEFSAILASKNIPCTVRLRRGMDIQAGCGQLATREALGKHSTVL